MKLAIIGFGFVGSAINYGFTKNIKKFILDPKYYPKRSFKELVEFSPDASFIAVPTPQGKYGDCDARILIKIVKELNQIKNHLVIIKSTVLPNLLEQIQKEYPNLKIVYNPEFLTEKNAKKDFCNPPMHIFGGSKKDTLAVKKIYLNHSKCKPCPCFLTSISMAALVKYCINSFLATKVTFMNEMYNLLQKTEDPNWELFSKILAAEPRLGKSHLKVPGADKKRGYGGKCFPKDTNALIYYARKISNSPLKQLENTIKINNNFRKG